MIPIFAGVSAIVPSILLLLYFRARDVNREPTGVLLKVFGLGVLTVIPVLLVAWPLSLVGKGLADPFALGAFGAFATAAIPEEFFKFVVVWFYASRHREFDEPMDGVVYGATASLGFATLENILYVGSGGLGVAILRAFTAVPGHAFAGAIMGYYVGRARFTPTGERGNLIFAALAIPTLLHGLYDFPLLTLRAYESGGVKPDDGLLAVLVLGTLATLVFEWIYAVRLTRRMRREQVTLAEQAARAQQAAATAPASLPRPAGEAPTFQPAGGFQPPPQAAPGQAPPPAPPVQAAPTFQPPQQFDRPPASSATPTSRGALGWFLLITGALLASVGGLMTLGVIGSLAAGETADADVGAMLLGGAIVGILPLGFGLWMFIAGLRRKVPER